MSPSLLAGNVSDYKMVFDQMSLASDEMVAGGFT